MAKKSIIIFTIFLLLLGTLTGCAGTGTGGASQGASDQKELVFSISSEPPNMDPQLITDGMSITIGNAVFEGLVRVYGDKILPGIAEKWDVSDDKKVYTFHLRDAKWSDGSKVTAYDFEYGIKRLLDPKVASGYSYQGYYILNGEDFNNGKVDASQVGVKALDEKTLQITLKAPVKYFESLIGFISFMPAKKEFVEQQGDKYGADADKLLYNGPFVIKEWKHEEELVLEKNPNYWNKDAIKLDRVRVVLVSEANTAYQMYENGELDFADVPEIMVDKLNGQGQKYADGFEYFIRFNQKAPGKPWLANENFRKAIGYAIDREDYVQMAFKGIPQPATRYVPPIFAGMEKKYVDEFPLDFYPTKADVAKAKELLNKAMQELNITDPSQISVDLLVDDGSGTKIGSDAIQDMLTRNLGIKVSISTVTFKERLQRMRKGDYEMMITRWGPDYDDPMTYLDYWYTSEGVTNSGVSSPEFDKLIDLAKNTSDFRQRFQVMFEAEKMLLERGNVIPLYNRQKIWVIKDYVKDLTRSYLGGVPDFIYTSVDGKGK